MVITTIRVTVRAMMVEVSFGFAVANREPDAAVFVTQSPSFCARSQLASCAADHGDRPFFPTQLRVISLNGSGSDSTTPLSTSVLNVVGFSLEACVTVAT